ncbi:MAG: hypothetical protein U7126_13210 [Microcoleus sp.]
MYATSDKSIGKVLTMLTVTNCADQSAATRGFIPTEQIRSITLDHVLVDRGATTLCLPDEAIAIPAKTQQQIAIGLYCFFSKKGDRSFGISQKVRSDPQINSTRPRISSSSTYSQIKIKPAQFHQLSDYSADNKLYHYE